VIARESLKRRRVGWRTIERRADIARPFDDVTKLLTTEGGQFVATRAEEGWGLELRVRPAGAGAPRTVLLHVGGLVDLGDRMLVPVSWADFGRPKLFTVLKAVIELVPADDRPAHTQMTLLGRYRPPLGGRGEEVERRSGADIVAESVTAFVVDLAARFEAELSGGPLPPSVYEPQLPSGLA